MASLSQRFQGSGFDNYLDDPDWTSPPTNLRDLDDISGPNDPTALSPSPLLLHWLDQPSIGSEPENLPDNITCIPIGHCTTPLSATTTSLEQHTKDSDFETVLKVAMEVDHLLPVSQQPDWDIISSHALPPIVDCMPRKPIIFPLDSSTNDCDYQLPDMCSSSAITILHLGSASGYDPEEPYSQAAAFSDPDSDGLSESEDSFYSDTGSSIKVDTPHDPSILSTPSILVTGSSEESVQWQDALSGPMSTPQVLSPTVSSYPVQLQLSPSIVVTPQLEKDIPHHQQLPITSQFLEMLGRPPDPLVACHTVDYLIRDLKTCRTHQDSSAEQVVDVHSHLPIHVANDYPRRKAILPTIWTTIVLFWLLLFYYALRWHPQVCHGYQVSQVYNFNVPLLTTPIPYLDRDAYVDTLLWPSIRSYHHACCLHHVHGLPPEDEPITSDSFRIIVYLIYQVVSHFLRPLLKRMINNDLLDSTILQDPPDVTIVSYPPNIAAITDPPDPATIHIPSVWHHVYPNYMSSYNSWASRIDTTIENPDGASYTLLQMHFSSPLFLLLILHPLSYPTSLFYSLPHSPSTSNILWPRQISATPTSYPGYGPSTLGQSASKHPKDVSAPT